MARPFVSPVMVGRRAELEELTAALEAARGGECVTVLLGGEAGVGKSRLISEFIAQTDETGVLPLVGQCVELGQDGLAYAPVASVLRALVKQRGEDAVLELAGSARGVLAGLLPELGPHTPVSNEGRGRLFEAVTDLLERAAAQTPLVLVVEDMHWADGSTRDLLRFALRVLSGSPILVVLTYRTDEVSRSHPLRPFLAELDRIRSVRRVAVPRLNGDEIAEQVREICGGDPEHRLLTRIQERGEGIPFFVEELVGAATDNGSPALPDPLRDLLLVRAERLSDPAQQMLRLLAFAGTRVGHRLLEAVSEADPDDLEASLHEAVSAGVLLVDGEEYVFRHALLKEAMYADTLPRERSRTHRRYADVLEGHPDLVTTGSAPMALAYHLGEAGEQQRAFRAYLDAGDRAQRIYAHRESLHAYEKALALWDRVSDASSHAELGQADLTKRAASAAKDAGELERALTLVDDARAERDVGADPSLDVDLVVLRSRVLGGLGWSKDESALRQTLEGLPASAPDELRAELLKELGACYLCSARHEEAIATARQVMRLAGDDPDTRLGAELTLGPSLAAHGEVDEGLRVLEAGTVRAVESAQLRIVSYINTSDVLNLLGRYAESAKVAESGLEEAANAGLTRTLGAMLAGNAAEPLLAMGEWERAERLVDRGIELDPPIRHQWHLQLLKTLLRLWRGDLAQAVELQHDVHESMARHEPDPQYAIPGARVAAEVALARDEPFRAWTHVQECLNETRRAPGYDLPLLAAGAQAVGERARRGDVDVEAANLLRSELERIGDWGPSAAWGALLDAELAGENGDDPEAWQAVLGQDPLPAYVPPYAQYRLACAWLAHGDRDRAAQALHAADEAAQALGAGLVASWVADLARRARLSTDRSTTSDDLTPREADVLRLIAVGQSNRQIGDALFISSKTASVHVSNILTKLDSSSRGEAAAVARERGLLEGD